MAVTKYFCKKNDTWYWRVYVQKQSSKFKYIREQKSFSRIPIDNKEGAKELEAEWKVKLATKVARREAQGCSWDELIERFELHYRRYPTKKMTQATLMDHVARLRSYTKDWLNTSCCEISFGDACELFEDLQDKNISKGLRRNIKGSINKVYKWGMQRKFILGVNDPPTSGIEIEDPEDFVEDEEDSIEILNESEIAYFLKRAEETKHPWASIWRFDLYTGLRAQELNGLRKEDITLISSAEALKLESQKPKNKINYGHIKLKRQWNKRVRKCTRLKGKYWRTIPLNSTLYWWLVEYLPKAKFGSDTHGQRVFERTKTFDNSEQASVIRAFCASEGIKSIKFHVLRACWATEVLRSGVAATDLMLMGGWKDYKTMMIYIKLAGVETIGATEGLCFEDKGTSSKSMSAAQWNELEEESIEGEEESTANVIRLFS